MKYLLNVLAFIPLCIEILLLIVIFPKKAMGVAWGTHVAIILLLTVVGIVLLVRKVSCNELGLLH